MYEQISHSLLNEILDELKPEIQRSDLRYFYTRLGANFYAIHTLFHQLYGQREDFKAQMVSLIEVMAARYIERSPALERFDLEREKDYSRFLSQEWVGMALYADGFADDLKGVRKRLPYVQELGVNMVHVMPILKCPRGADDGGYAVSDFHSVDPRVGSLEDVRELATDMHKRDMLLTLDVVVNHVSDQHEWASRAQAGDERYMDYFYIFKERDVPDMFEETMLEIFPETSPENFTWNEEIQHWVMTVFHDYQWDLNYSNPVVFIEMIDIILFWANQGADIVRLDAVAFLWKKIGTTCQNLHEAHLILQLMKDCCQVTAPGVLFIAEAIVAPVEIIKYFGEDAIIAKECEIAYNATFMALLWDAVATRNANLLNQGLRSQPDKLDRATWLNYVRCHDDIGLGFDDADINRAGYDPQPHRNFLVDYFTGVHPGSDARGHPFAQNAKTGDVRIAGSLASLAGLEVAIETNDEAAIERAVRVILMLHSMILSYGGIPLLYYGDEVGTLNDLRFLQDQSKADDKRWMNRPRIDWEKLEQRSNHGSVEQRIFDGLRNMIAVRKVTPAFADFNNRELLDVDNEHLFVFLRTHPENSTEKVLVVANFDANSQYLNLNDLHGRGRFHLTIPYDLCTGESPALFKDQLVIPPYRFYWLTDQRAGVRYS